MNLGQCACRSILDINLGIPGIAKARVHHKEQLLASGRRWIFLTQPGLRTDITLRTTDATKRVCGQRSRFSAVLGGHDPTVAIDEHVKVRSVGCT